MEDPGVEAAFGTRLRVLRQSRALTQEELAERAGLSAKAVGALERGERRRPYPHTVRALADALELDDGERRGLVAAVPGRGNERTGAPDEPVGPGPTDRDVAAPARATRTMAGPDRTTPLVGREAEAARIVALVREQGRRLVTLTGPGGVGKSRLAAEVADRLAGGIAGGVVVVEVASVRDPALVLPRLALALGLPDVAGSSPEALAPHLAGRPVLVVLDNLEQVLDCAPDLARVVATCPDLVVVATSRAPLRVRAEHEVPITPLAVPDDGDLDPATVAASPAVHLFLDRCAAAGADVVLGDDTAATIGAICRRLDGLPLALELAAASMRLLPLDGLLDRLDTATWAAEVRDLPARQRTVAAVIDGSLDLLGGDERTVFRRLAVFGGGFFLDAVEAVAGGDPDDPDEHDGDRRAGDASAADVERVVAALVDHALVLRVPDVAGRRPRLRLLEPVRQDAMARLHRAGTAVVTADRHAGHFTTVAREAFGRLRGPELVACMDELDLDHANLRAALLRLDETGRAREAADLVHGAWLHLALRGHAREGLSWLARLGPTLAAAADVVASSTAGVAEAGLRHVVGDTAGLRPAAETALAGARDHGRHDLVVEAAVLAADGAMFAGDVTVARDHLDEAAEYCPDLDDPWATAHVRLARGQLALVMGRVDEARGHLAAVEATARARDDAFTLATVLNITATTTELAGDHERSAALLAEATRLSVEANMSWTLGYALPALAGVAAQLGADRDAALLFGASASVAATAAVDPAFPPTRSLTDRELAAVRSSLGEAAFRAAWDAGRVATDADLVAVAGRLSPVAPA